MAAAQSTRGRDEAREGGKKLRLAHEQVDNLKTHGWINIHVSAIPTPIFWPRLPRRRRDLREGGRERNKKEGWPPWPTAPRWWETPAKPAALHWHVQSGQPRAWIRGVD